jgi:membrane fusion protein (multidrug efflux system)
MNTTTTSAAPSEPAAPGKRKKALTAIAAVVVVAGLGLAAYEWLVASHYEETDNAYVQGNLVQITPQIGGTVMAILADDTDRVQAGQPLVQLDPADGRVALEQAEAQLAQTVRQVRTLYANNGALGAQVALRDADVVRARTEIGRAQSEVARANDDLNRRQSLSGNGAVSREELHHAQTTLANTKSALAAAEAGVQSAQAAAAAAREQLASNQSMTEGTSVEQHPSVLAAAAKVREAWLATQRAALPAPVSGYVAKRSVQLGQRVAAGTPLMAVVPLDQLWVDANFKEVQLRNIRIGQPVKLTADVYGKKVEYKGEVSGLGVGTGAAFALLPAQNATGNWIKVVQRVPVRIALDPQQVVANPLRVGLSMDVTVDVTHKDGRTLAEAPRSTPLAATAVYAADARGADEQVRRVIAANVGPALRGAQSPVARAPARAAATQTAQAAH